MTDNALRPEIRLRIKLQPQIIIGPGKADILAGIRETGSISATGRLMSMSYKRIWQLVNQMNHEYCEPLVFTSTGGPHGGGATLTPTGEKVLKVYEKIIASAYKAISKEIGTLRKLTVNTPPGLGH